jgi:ribose-phosphate pyrophosphokinase
MIISPDEGGMSRCIYYSSVLGVDLGMFYKRRNYSVIVNGRNPIEAHEYLGNDVEGKDVIIVDDMISSGDSMLDIVKQLHERKASRVFVFSTFGLFCEGLKSFDQAYESGMLDMVFTTNLVYRSPELLKRDWYCEVDMSKYIAYIIDALYCDKSMSKLLNPVERIKKLMDRNRNAHAGK